MPLSHVTVRVPQELLKAIDETAAGEATNRSKWIKQTLRKAVATGAMTRPPESDLSSIQELIEVQFETIQEDLETLKELKQLLESVVKLSIEAVMIARQLALHQGPSLLEKAQSNAREYYTRRVATEKPNGTPPETL